jgi:Protein of unknown function (DUF982)
MSQHRFRLGDRVTLTRACSAIAAEEFFDRVVPIDRRRPAPDVWEVTQLLPADSFGPQYHIRAESDGLEWVVHEHQLALCEARMGPCRFDKLVVIEDTRRVGSLRNVGSVLEAAETLLDKWPKGRGPKHREALRACHACLSGEIPTESARAAFIEAAIEVGILIGEAPARRRF